MCVHPCVYATRWYNVSKFKYKLPCYLNTLQANNKPPKQKTIAIFVFKLWEGFEPGSLCTKDISKHSRQVLNIS